MTRKAGQVLVTGATGFLGSAVVAHLRAAGRPICATVRETGASAGTGTVAVGDLNGETDWTTALAGVDAVVHCAARAHVLKETAADPLAQFRRVNTEGALALARQAAASGVRRLIFISSIGVNGAETRGTPFSANDAPRPHSPYAQSKHEAEQGLAAIATNTGMEVVVIRPPLITGPDPKGNLGTLARFISLGLPLPFGLVTRNRRDLVSRETLCRLIGTCLDHPAAPGRTFLVSDGAPISTRHLLETLAADMGRRLRLLPVPPILLAVALDALGRSAMRSQLLADLEVDIGPTCETLGWRP